MANGTLQQSGDVTAQLEQLITTLGGTPTADGKTGLLKQLNAALAAASLGSAMLPLAPTGAVAESFPRVAGGGESVTIATVSGTTYMTAVYIPINTVVNSINVVVGTTASSNDVTINWAALCNGSRVVLAVTPNATAQLTPSGEVNTLTFTTPFTTTYSGLYYVAYTVGATTTQPTLCGNTAAGTELNKIAPIVSGTTSTAATSTPPAVASTLGTITGTASTIYVYLD